MHSFFENAYTGLSSNCLNDITVYSSSILTLIAIIFIGFIFVLSIFMTEEEKPINTNITVPMFLRPFLIQLEKDPADHRLSQKLAGQYLYNLSRSDDKSRSDNNQRLAYNEFPPLTYLHGSVISRLTGIELFNKIDLHLSHDEQIRLANIMDVWVKGKRRDRYDIDTISGDIKFYPAKGKPNEPVRWMRVDSYIITDVTRAENAGKNGGSLLR